uniref:PRELI/MSF1 domain-containing protein n=1 Tax=Panagrolaimus sp. JU765 TaxID=591449 RepID=A0AC34PXE0_9BILA
MKYWTSPLHFFDYSFNEVASVFYDRYPNSFAKHVVSEDVIDRKVTENIIYTKKLVVKKGASFLKSVPKWMSTLTSIRVVPTLEESIYDRRTNSLVTYTRNVSHCNLFQMHEKSIYEFEDFNKTSLARQLFVSINYPRFSSLIERLLVMTFRNSVRKTLNGIQEKLEERYGFHGSTTPSKVAAMSEKATLITDKLLHRKSKFGLEKA